MDFCRRDRVVTGQNVAGENRQGKRLIAGAVKIAAGELIVFIERMIDLPDEAVHVIQRAGCDKDVRPARVVKQRQRSIWRRPWIARQQSGNDGIAWTAERRDFTRIRNARSGTQTDALSLTFISEVEEGAVALDRTAERAAKLIVSECGLGVRPGIENVARVESVVAEKLEERTMKIVRSGFSHDVHDCA